MSSILKILIAGSDEFYRTIVREVSFILPIGTCVLSAVATAITSCTSGNMGTEQRFACSLEQTVVPSYLQAITAENLLAGTVTSVTTELPQSSLFVELEPTIRVVFYAISSGCTRCENWKMYPLKHVGIWLLQPQ